MNRLFALLAGLLLASSLQAQTYPDRTAPGVNDFAGVIEDEAEARIADKLAAIQTDHGVEAAIVTLSSLRFYATYSTIEAYSEGLFNAWGLGNPARNDGILILVFRDDRELRLQVGAGYGEEMQKAFDRLIDEDVLPDFRAGDLTAGLESGVDALVPRIIAPPAANTASTQSESGPAGADDGGGNTIWYVLGAVGAAILGLIGLNRRNAAKFAAQPCANCGKAGLQKSREVLREPTLDQEGAGETRITCPSCGYVESTPYTISKRKPVEPTGGGTSKGGGATGKW